MPRVFRGLRAMRVGFTVIRLNRVFNGTVKGMAC